MMPFWIVPLGLVLAGVGLYAYMCAKVENALICHMIIIRAIREYQKDRILAKDLAHINDVKSKDMEDLEQTIYRLTDWGYKRILPKEKYKLVKPFINRKETMKDYRKLKKKENTDG